MKQTLTLLLMAALMGCDSNLTYNPPPNTPPDIVRTFNDLRYDQDCGYTLPTGWKLVKSQETGLYAIGQDRPADHYPDFLFNFPGGYQYTSSLILGLAPSRFGDSCKAKAAFKHYLKQQEDLHKESEEENYKILNEYK